MIQKEKPISTSRDLLNNSYFSIFNSVLRLVLSMGIGVIIARHLGPQGKGVYYLLLQYIMIGSLVLSVGVGPSILFNIKGGIISIQEALFFIFELLTVLLTVIVILSAFNIEYLSIVFNNSITESIILAGAILVTINIGISLYGNILISQRTFGVKMLSLISSLCGVINLIFLVLAIVVFDKGINGALGALFFSSSIQLIIIIMKVHALGFKHKIIKFVKIKVLYKYGFGIFISNLFLTSIYRIDVFLINSILSTSELGIYSVSVNISELILFLPTAIGIALFPHLVSVDDDQKIHTTCKVARLNIFTALIISTIILLISYPMINLLFGSEFIGALFPAWLLVPGMVFLAASNSYSNYLNSKGLPYLTSLIFMVGLVFNVVLNLIFLKSFGLLAAALNSTVAYMIIAILLVIIIKNKEKRLTYSDLVVPKREDIISLIRSIKGVLVNING